MNETRGMARKGYSPSIALVPTYLIGNENQSSVVRQEDGKLETCARRGLWPSCLRISLARENQSTVVRLTTGGTFVCLCFLDWITLMLLLRCYCSLNRDLRVTILQQNTKKRILTLMRDSGDEKRMTRLFVLICFIRNDLICFFLFVTYSMLRTMTQYT